MTKSEVYNEQMMPHLKEAHRLAVEAGINFFALFDLEPADDAEQVATITQLTAESTAELSLMLRAALYAASVTNPEFGNGIFGEEV